MDLARNLSRRFVSPHWLGEPGPDDDGVRDLVGAACAGTDHRDLRPFRFLHISNDARTWLADLFVKAADETHGEMTRDQLSRARENAMNGTTHLALVVSLRSDVTDVPEYERWIAGGAALHNALLAAHAKGFSAKILSGDKVGTAALRKGLGVAPSEQLVGFVAIGTAAKTPNPRTEPDIGTLLSRWPSEERTVA